MPPWRTTSRHAQIRDRTTRCFNIQLPSFLYDTSRAATAVLHGMAAREATPQE